MYYRWAWRTSSRTLSIQSKAKGERFSCALLKTLACGAHMMSKRKKSPNFCIMLWIEECKEVSVEHFTSEKEINEQFHKWFSCDVPASWGCHKIPFLRKKYIDLTELENHPVNLLFSSNSEKNAKALLATKIYHWWVCVWNRKKESM